ncbi:hypothetical protein RZS08_57700, partial [Arthrospira platensis SPKY1]|nr:hypothetical protein [Arthrospira platensis SPKY1]
MNNEILSLHARFNRLERDMRLGVIARSDAEIERNRIVAALLSIIDELREEDLREAKDEPNTRQEVGSSEDTPSLPARWMIASGRSGINEVEQGGSEGRISFAG